MALQPHALLLSLALTIFLSSLLGNGLMILLTLWDPGLHTPMRFPLSQLPLMDLMLAATTVPDGSQPPAGHQVHLSRWLRSPDLPVTHSGRGRVLPPSSHGL